MYFSVNVFSPTPPTPSLSLATRSCQPSLTPNQQLFAPVFISGAALPPRLLSAAALRTDGVFLFCPFFFCLSGDTESPIPLPALEINREHFFYSCDQCSGPPPPPHHTPPIQIHHTVVNLFLLGLFFFFFLSLLPVVHACERDLHLISISLKLNSMNPMPSRQ